MEKYKCVIIGTGFSGIAMAIKLKEQGIHDFILLEKAETIGGTWRENTYPGAECDIPSALYSYSFEPYPEWEYKWSMQAQILKYIEYVCNKYEIYPHIHFNKEMTKAKWEPSEGSWHIETKDGSNYVAQTMVTAVGQLHHPSTPEFVGKESFAGPSFHSAEWDHEVSLEGKSVGVIGNAASATQFIPEIAKIAEHVTVFQRSANWMLPKQDRLYKEWEKKLVRKFPGLLKAYRLRLWLLGGGLFFLMSKGNNWLRKTYEGKTIRYIEKHIKDPKTVEALTPDYPMGAKRVLFSDSYYSALARNNVSLVTGSIKEITPAGLVLNHGKKHSLDVLIYATGFKTNPFLLDLEIIGDDSTSIQEAWKEGPVNYLGINVSKFPNFFMMYGPNTNLGHNSIIVMAEAQAKYIAQCIIKMKKSNWKSLDIKSESMMSYHKSIQDRLQNMAWAQVEKSWYKSENGNLPNNYPGRTMEYMRKTKNVDFGKYNIT